MALITGFIQETSRGTYIVVPNHSVAAVYAYFHSVLSYSAFIETYTDKYDPMCLRFPKHVIDNIESLCCNARL